MNHYNENEFYTRYSRQLILNGFGLENQNKLKNCKVLIVGCGGLGAPVIQYLSSAGIGHLTLCDGDGIELSNLSRQVIFRTSDIGKNKAECAAEFIKNINPDVLVEVVDRHIGFSDVQYEVSRHDLVVDCTDGIPIKYLLNDACVIQNKTLIHGAASSFDGRLLLIQGNKGPCLRCIFEEILLPNGTIGNCSTIGVLGPICGIVGSTMAVYSILYLLGKPVEQKYLVWNFLSENNIHSYLLEKNSECKACGDSPIVNSYKEKNYTVNCDIE